MLYVRCTHVACCVSYVARCALRFAHRLADSDHREPLEAEAEGPARLGWPLRVLHDLPTAQPQSDPNLTRRHSANEVCPCTRRQRCRRVPCAVGCTAMHALASTRPVPGPYPARTRPVPGPCPARTRPVPGPYPASTRPVPGRYHGAETACLALDHTTAEHFEPLAL